MDKVFMSALSTTAINREEMIRNKQEDYRRLILFFLNWYLYASSSLQMGRREYLSYTVYWGCRIRCIGDYNLFYIGWRVSHYSVNGSSYHPLRVHIN